MQKLTAPRCLLLHASLSLQYVDRTPPMLRMFKIAQRTFMLKHTALTKRPSNHNSALQFIGRVHDVYSMVTVVLFAPSLTRIAISLVLLSH